jgi:4-amino-4-deoxy-L-arabinose transferase-like glycosyltransferase
MTLDQLAAGIRPYLLLALLTLMVALPGIATIPPLDRDESRFAVASRQMIESGDWVTVRYQDEIRAKKPAGAYWLQAASAELTGAVDQIWAYRIPSVLGILVAVTATFFFGRTLVGAPAALCGAALLAVTPLVASEAHQAKTDALLLACVVVAQGALAKYYLAARRGEAKPGWGVALAFWLAQAAGILIKGPILPMVSALTIAALLVADRRVARGFIWLRGLRPLPGVALTIVLVAPWAIAVSLATQGQFIRQAVGHDFLLKLYDPPEAHEGWPGIYALLATATLWPGSLFILPGLVRAIPKRAEPAMRFCLAWAVPTWLLFELVPTKLPHYVLPAVPALVLMAGATVAAKDFPLHRSWPRLYAMLCALVGVAVAIAAVGAPLALGTGFAWTSIPCAVAALFAAIAPAALLLRGRIVEAAGAAVIGAGVTLAFLFGGVMPALDQLWLAERAATLVPPGAPAAAAGFREPSLVFRLGTRTKLTDGAGAAAFLLAMPRGVAVVEDTDELGFEKALAAAGRGARMLGEVDGLNYSRGKPVRLDVWTLGQKQ